MASFCEYGDGMSFSITGGGRDFSSGLIGDHQVLETATRV
jgi:hypothetical protein